MLATFVVALREGVEASLIVGIIAAFLVRQQRKDVMRAMWLGVAAAVIVCIGVGIAATSVDAALPRRAQEGFETIAASIAVAAITGMIVWMKKHARSLRAELEASAATALQAHSFRALVIVAFLSVLREGLETVAFVIAVFAHAADAVAARVGVIAGLLASVGIGYGIYRGGSRIHLGRFFQITSIVLVFVCAGLCAAAVHSAHEAGFIAFGQGVVFDASRVLGPSTVAGALLQALFGITARPALIELLAWAAYLLPALAFLFLPNRTSRTFITKTTARSAR